MDNQALTQYMNRAIRQLVQDVFKNTLNNPRETAFLLRFRHHSRLAARRRTELEAQGHHIPSFLIASITQSCNLFCSGCYARAGGICREAEKADELTGAEWNRLFEQARQAGIQFILLAGGEPLIRQDVLEEAAQFGSILFPIFTNGTLIDQAFCAFLDKHRNLVPVLSLEGGQDKTDQRRGPGTFDMLLGKMQILKKHDLLYGVSITVTRDNLEEVTSESYVGQLNQLGCRLLFTIEYVPVDPISQLQAITDPERKLLAARQVALKKRYPSIFFLSFPGDEAEMGGCLAAGRGFFHISPSGEAQACPFSPYADRSLRRQSLLDVLRSDFFKNLQQENLVGGEHTGGCTLYERRDAVAAILQRSGGNPDEVPVP
ncbi:MAG: radical SAM protein [Clostridiaceae bacterium]|nr:radical SAM protein [Clostridiaceae bacterium]